MPHGHIDGKVTRQERLSHWSRCPQVSSAPFTLLREEMRQVRVGLGIDRIVKHFGGDKML